MRILWESNDVRAGTGYGVVTRNVCTRLAKLGYEVAVYVNWGLVSAKEKWQNLTLYPTGVDPTGREVIPMIVKDFQPNIFIALLDIWAFSFLPELSHSLGVPFISQSPTDTEPIPETIEVPSKKSYRVIAIAKFSQRNFQALGIDAVYIPHGVDTKVFHPVSREEKREIRLRNSIPEDAFILLNIAMNKGFRKNFEGLFRAFSIFLENNPDARRDAFLFLHTQKKPKDGVSLPYLASYYFLEDNLLFSSEVDIYTGLETDRLVKLYNIADAFILLTKGEGFGIPVLEAMACGVPCIVSNNTSMPELVGDHGWLVPIHHKEWNPLGAWWSIPDEWKAAEAIAEAYNGKNLNKFASASRAFSLQYDWEKIVSEYWCPFLQEVKEDIGL